ncbi:glycosyltransferase family 2 protein [Neobacillus mesonae]|uniref:glycosyltransferase family 2 protein n=1 Tax=Neobacillus mesonae TaxID=1193713 RepID=UPI00203D8B04|nr:glycosyltransferase family 2 protein [Neobacillus mesonae]MCM3568575.1 glycosyltransferase family 2 protein [Neobacillus mesonae]
MIFNQNKENKLKPATSIIILTRNCLSFTKECIASIFKCTSENFELIIIDNASTDGTVQYLRTLPKTTVISNRINKGFSGGCNQGLKAANGENIVFLNNDTVVTRGWLTRLLKWINQDETIGIVGPRSNYIVPQQAINPVPYKSIKEMPLFAAKWTKNHFRQGYEADYLSGLCMAFKKELVDNIGGLDERFFPGYFEDTDFSIRARISGKKLWVANDVYIHHYGSSSFKINRSMQRKAILESEEKFKQKWNITNLSEINEAVEREKPFRKEFHYIPC